MPGTPPHAPALRHALRAELALLPQSGLARSGIDDAAARALDHFTLDGDGNLISATGETFEDWVTNLRTSAPHLFEDAAPKLPRPFNLGSVGDGRVNHRLDWANQQAAKQ